MKYCTACKSAKDADAFSKRSKKCKDCVKLYNKQYREINKEKLSVKKSIYYEINKQHILQCKREFYNNNRDYILAEVQFRYDKRRTEILDQQRLYRASNKDRVRNYHKEYRKEKLSTDPAFKLKVNCSRLIHHVLKDSKAKLSILEFLPFSIEQLKQHLEKQFEPWMNWNNYGSYRKKSWDDNDSKTWTWQIDHIIPQCKLPYSSMSDSNFVKCWSLNNLRPISSKINLLKGKNENFI